LSKYPPDFLLRTAFLVPKTAVEAFCRFRQVSTEERNTDALIKVLSDAPPRTGLPGRPKTYGQKLKLTELFDTRRSSFEQARIELYGQAKDVAFLCLDLLRPGRVSPPPAIAEKKNSRQRVQINGQV